MSYQVIDKLTRKFLEGLGIEITKNVYKPHVEVSQDDKQIWVSLAGASNKATMRQAEQLLAFAKVKKLTASVFQQSDFTFTLSADAFKVPKEWLHTQPAKAEKGKGRGKATKPVPSINGLGLKTTNGVLFDDLVLGAVVNLHRAFDIMFDTTCQPLAIVVGLVENLPKKWFAPKTLLSKETELSAEKHFARLDKATVLVMPFDDQLRSTEDLPLWLPPMAVPLGDIASVAGRLSGTAIHGKSVTQPWVMPIQTMARYREICELHRAKWSGLKPAKAEIE